MVKIFPKEIIDFTIEHQIARHTTRTQIIYIILLLLFVICFAVLPFIKVDVTVESSGIIRPSQGSVEITSPVSGKVGDIFIKENQIINKGDTLLIIDDSQINDQINYLKNRIVELETLIEDLTRLQSGVSESIFSNLKQLKTSIYFQQYNEFKQKSFELRTEYLKEEKDFNRSKLLYESNSISQKEFEESKFEFDRIKATINTFEQSQLLAWAGEQKKYTEEILSIKSELQQLLEESKNYYLISPIKGSVQGSEGLVKGLHILSGKKLFALSPDTRLNIETYLHPKDIGFIKEGLDVKYQIEAFNYNQWGMATGKVIDISKDITIQADNPAFIVKCSLNENSLHLKNGYEGNLIKGMTLKARFIITKRTLWQLLYDKVDNWLNPNA